MTDMVDECWAILLDITKSMEKEYDGERLRNFPITNPDHFCGSLRDKVYALLVDHPEYPKVRGWVPHVTLRYLSGTEWSCAVFTVGWTPPIREVEWKAEVIW